VRQKFPSSGGAGVVFVMNFYNVVRQRRTTPLLPQHPSKGGEFLQRFYGVFCVIP
jgi:hypothetical protein